MKKKTRQNTKKPHLHRWIGAIILSVFCIVVYSETMTNHFTYDDYSVIYENDFIKNWTRDPGFFFNDSYFKRSGEASYRPVGTLTHFLNYLIWKLNPAGYHLTSILLHITSVLLIFFILQSLLNDSLVSLLGALFFASHPVLAESINCITFNEDILAGLFCFASFLSYIIFKNKNSKRPLRFFILSLTFYVLGLFSKEMAITLPLMIIIYDLVYHPKNENEKPIKFLLRMVHLNKVNYLGFLLISILYLFVRFKIFSSPSLPLSHSYGHWLTRIIYLPYQLMQYMKLALIPYPLTVDYHFSYPQSFMSMPNMLALLATATIFIACVYLYKKEKNAAFGMIWFFVSLIPVSNIYQIEHPLAERYLYLPLFGFILMLVSLIHRFKIKGEKIQRSHFIRIVVSIVIILTYSAITIRRNKDWKNNETLWKKTIEVSPQSFRAHNGLGLIYYEKGLLEQAKEEYLLAIKSFSNDSRAHNNLGLVYVKLNDYGSALNEFEIAVQVNPRYTVAFNNLGNLYNVQGDLQKAISYYKKSIEADPDYSLAYCNLATTYAQYGSLDEAIESFSKAILINPIHLEAYMNLGIEYAEKGEYENAKKIFTAILKEMKDKRLPHAELQDRILGLMERYGLK